MARKKLLTEGEIRQFMKLANLSPLADNTLQEMGMPSMSSMPGARDEEMDVAAVEMDDPMGGEEEIEDMEAVDEMPPAEGEMSLSDEEAMAIIDLADRLRDAMGPEEGEEEMEMDMEMGPEGGEEEFEADIEEEPPGMRYEEKDYTAKKEKPGADKRKGAKLRGAEGTKKKTIGKGRGEKKGDDAYVNESEELDEITATGRGYDTGKPRKAKKLPSRGQPSDEGPHGPLIDEPTEVLPGTDPKDDPPVQRSSARKKSRWEEAVAGDDAMVAEVARRVAARLQAQTRHEEVVDQLAERIMKRLTK